MGRELRVKCAELVARHLREVVGRLELKRALRNK
jgi:hypothetical protein